MAEFRFGAGLDFEHVADAVAVQTQSVHKLNVHCWGNQSEIEGAASLVSLDRFESATACFSSRCENPLRVVSVAYIAEKCTRACAASSKAASLSRRAITERSVAASWPSHAVGCTKSAPLLLRVQTAKEDSRHKPRHCVCKYSKSKSSKRSCWVAMTSTTCFPPAARRRHGRQPQRDYAYWGQARSKIPESAIGLPPHLRTRR